MNITPLLKKALQGEYFSSEESANIISYLKSADEANIQLVALFSAIRTRGESCDELVGFIRAIQADIETIDLDTEGALDNCGTGGDGKNTFNLSTAAAIVLAGAGIKMLKHGGSSVSSQCGSLQVLTELGIRIPTTTKEVEQLSHKTHFIFLHAPRFNPIFEKVALLRKTLGVPTTFNILGPLVNPARVSRQVIGCFDEKLLMPMAMALQKTGSMEVMLVHSEDGLDEVSIAAPTRIVHLKEGKISQSILHPEAFGIPIGSLDEIRGGNAALNANIIRKILAGEKSAYRNAVVLNAGVAAVVAGKVSSIQDGIALANQSIDSGVAASVLRVLGETS